MEYLEGSNLKVFFVEVAKKGNRVSVKTALEIVKSVLGALKAVHISNIIHRDIKPGNIFICKNGTIKLIDSGAARFSEQDADKIGTVIITSGYALAERLTIQNSNDWPLSKNIMSIYTEVNSDFTYVPNIINTVQGAEEK